LAKTKPVSLAIDFDKISSELKTFGRLTDEQVKSAQAFADQIGIDYPLSANKALQAILSLKKAGQALGDIRNILPSAADISSLRDDQSIDAASKSLIAFAGGFGEFAEGVPASFDNIAVASDILAAGAVSSTASVDELSAGLAKVAPSAKDAGIDMRDVAAALGLLDRAQIKGVAGGTALRGILNSLIRPKSLDELARLNVATLNADGSQRSLNQITTDLAESYDRLGFSQDQRNQSMAQIAEVESRAALSILVTNGGLSDQLSLMDEVSTANELASQKIDNLAGDIGQLKGSIETFMKNAALPMISRFFRPIVKLARLVVDGLLQLPEAVLETASTMIFLGSAIATVTAATIVLIGVLSIVSGAFMSVVASVALLAFNLPAVIIGITGILGSLLVLIPVLTAIAALWVGLSHIITTAFRQIEGNINGA
jgi:TP901 family phage tail tape measure protein